jgi:hypothetical protein
MKAPVEETTSIHCSPEKRQKSPRRADEGAKDAEKASKPPKGCFSLQPLDNENYGTVQFFPA